MTGPRTRPWISPRRNSLGMLSAVGPKSGAEDGSCPVPRRPLNRGRTRRPALGPPGASPASRPTRLHGEADTSTDCCRPPPAARPWARSHPRDAAANPGHLSTGNRTNWHVSVNSLIFGEPTPATPSRFAPVDCAWIHGQLRRDRYVTPRLLWQEYRTRHGERCGERVIGRKQRGIVAAYDVHSYSAEKRAALQKWASHLVPLQA